MADPLIANNTYTITNGANDQNLNLNVGPQVAINLANPAANNNQRWRAINVNLGTSNQIILQNVANPGFFATAINGTQIAGTGNTTIWTVEHVGGNAYRIRTGPDPAAAYLRFNPAGAVLTFVLAIPGNAQEVQWTFTGV